MNVMEMQRSLRQLRLGGMAETLQELFGIDAPIVLGPFGSPPFVSSDSRTVSCARAGIAVVGKSRSRGISGCGRSIEASPG